MDGSLQALIESSHKGHFSYDGDFRVDDTVLSKFRQGTKVLSAHRYGTSAWNVKARLRLQLPDGSDEQYFLKSAPEAHGRTQMEGEFNAMSELHKWAPDFVPKPHSWGKYALEEPVVAYFFLASYVDMSARMSDPEKLCAKLTQLHRESRSPDDQFGFHVTTCQGRVPQSVGWEKSWKTFFTRLLQHVIDMDFDLNGDWDELDQVEKRLIAHVIPRLLGVLEENGRSVKPSLIHADLWEGNIGTSFDGGDIYVFDSAAFYAHNEMEVGDWRCSYNKIGNGVYTRTYLQHQDPSEPKEEWDDRNRLYCVYFNVIYSCNHLAQGNAVRQAAYTDMYYLIDKYAPFPPGQGPPKLAESEMASLSSERDHASHRDSNVHLG